MEFIRFDGGRGRWKRWFPGALVMTVIFGFSSIPGDSMPEFRGLWDLVVKKGAHLAIYALLGMAFFYAVWATSRRPFLLAWGLAVIYAFSDEFHQSFVPARGATLIDVGIDGVGALLGLGVVWLCLRYIEEKRG